jgi:P pilus assembly chaperone PapD
MFFKHFRRVAFWLWPGFAMMLAAPSQAGIVLGTTRVILPAPDKEAALMVRNTGAGDILAQSWIEAEGDSGASGSLPFAVTPPLARMSGDGRQLVRIIYSGEGLPKDRESVFWVNVQEIPQTGKENQLQIAIRQRIKLFYRPMGLAADPLKAAEALQWQVRDGVLEVSNPGPFHVSMIMLEARRNGQLLLQEDGRMLGPMQRLQLPLSSSGKPGALELAFVSINDYGAQEPYRARVSSEQVVQASKVEQRSDE